MTENKQTPQKPDRHIGYFIFVAIAAFILAWLIVKKVNMPEEKPLKSLPGERPSNAAGSWLADSLDRNDTIYAEEISLLSPELPRHRVSEPVAPPPLDLDDDYSDYGYTSDAGLPSLSVPTSNTTLKLTTEQSVRNLLISNRFIDPETSDVITFTSNGNVLMKNGEAQTSEMEVDQLSGTLAVLNFYDDNNSSWDVQLDVSGDSKKIRMMNVEYKAD